MRGVVFKKVRQRWGIGKVVHCHHVNIREIFPDNPYSKSADSSKTIDCQFDFCHLIEVSAQK
jgi:hypothetical protein